MQKAYIILAHKNPEQLYRLIKRLDDNASSFFVHIDKKADIESFGALKNYGEKIVFTKRENGRWGGFGIVQATLNALQEIRSSGRQFDFINLLSGQDYPIKSNEEINRFLAQHPFKIYIASFGSLPIERWVDGGLRRINNFWFGVNKYQRKLTSLLSYTILFLPFLKKKIPYNLTIYGGSQWWTIDMYTLNYILLYVKKQPGIIRFFKYALLPDEMFFQTIIFNAVDEKILNSIAASNMRFIMHAPRKKHPETLTKDNFNEIKNSGALFARKFDPEIDDEVLNLIDRQCLV